MTYLYAAVLAVLNTISLFLVAIGLPGNWLMVLFTAAAAWLRWEERMFSPWTLAAMAGIALLAEVVEFAAGAAGSKKAGGGWLAATGAIVLGLVGGIVGTFAIPIPVAGSILGACIGASGGAILGDLTMGKDWTPAVRVGKGAFVGRLLGTVYKLALGSVIWLVATVASFI